MKVLTITTTLLLTSLSLAAPSPSKEAARSITESVNTRLSFAKRGEDKTPKDEGCPGGKDFGFCVPWLGGTYCSMPGPSVGAFPMPDAECHTQVNQICGCWCSCSKEMCEAALLPVPDYCG